MEIPKYHNSFLLGLLFVVGLLLILLAQKYPTSSDSIGYVYAAERLVAGEGLSYEDSYNQSAGSYFALFAFQIKRDNDERFYLGFPPGLPLLLATGMLLLGNELAIRFFVPILALLGVYITYLLGNQLGERRIVGLVAAVFLVTTAIFWQFGTSVWSEIPSMTLVTTGFYFFIRSRNEKSSKRELILFSVISGVLFVFSFFIRYANLILMPAIGLFELFHSGKNLWRKPSHWLFFIIVSLGLVGILLFNNGYYGGYTITSYSPVHGWYPDPAFSASYVWGPSFVNGYSLREALNTAWLNFFVFLVFIPLGWLKMKRPFGMLSATAIISTIFFYSFYAFAAAGINSRFLLPIFPLIAISIAVGFVFVVEKIPASLLRALAIVGCGVLLLWPLPNHFEELQKRNQNAENRVAKIEEMTSFSSPESVFLSYAFNDQIRYYGERSVFNYRRIPPSDVESGRYLITEYFEPCLVQTIDRLLAQDIPVYYVLDREPSFWKSFEAVQTYYETQLQQNDPNIYLIIGAKTRPASLESCDS